MASYIELPSNKEQLSQAIKFIINAGRQRRNPQAIRWWIARHYMRGVRNFHDINYSEGSLRVSYYDEEGVLHFVYEDIVSQFQSQLGRLMGIDFSPIVAARGMSLDGMRKVGIGQVVLDKLFPGPKVSSLQRRYFCNLLLYGTVAMIPWVSDDDETVDIDLVPPWELVPIPIDASDPESASGLLRCKMVPVDWLKQLPGVPGEKSKIWREMKTAELPIGYIAPDSKSQFGGSVAFGLSSIPTSRFYSGSKPVAGRGGEKDQTKVEAVQAAEVWTRDREGYWKDYVLWAGGRVLARKDYEGMRKDFPPQVSSDVQVGNYWGRPYVDLLIPLNSEIEDAMARQLQMIKDWDLYGLFMEPTTSGVPAKVNRGADGLKRVRFEPDHITPELKPYNLNPTNPTQLPALILKQAIDLQTKIANQPGQLMSGNAPGRVDSASGLGFLFETSSVPLTPTAKIGAAAFINCYRVALNICRERWGDDKILELTHLDDNIAGIQFNSQEGTIKLANNAIPHPDDVVINVASAVPRSKHQRIMQLNELLKAGIITPTEFRITARKEGLDLPVGNEIEWQNYRKAVWQNILLFNDGITPGHVIYSDRDLHPIHLMQIDAFMAKPEFSLASQAILDAFIELRDMHLDGMGQIPEGMPEIEEAAAEMVMQTKARIPEAGLPPIGPAAGPGAGPGMEEM